MNNDLVQALDFCSSIKNEKNLGVAIKSFIHFQHGKITESLNELENANRSTKNNIFLHLCINLKAFISIQNGRFEDFEALANELSSLEGKETSHLAPLIQSNFLYFSKYKKEDLGNYEDISNKHYENVHLYHSSRELNLLEVLKNVAIRLFSDEVYENLDIYGKETIRFNNTPDAIGKRISRFIFLNSFMGSHAGFSEGSKHFLKMFFTIGDLYKNQALYKEALRNAICIGSSKDIEKIVKSPAFIKDDGAASYFEKMILGNPYQGPTAIGISYLIKNTYQFISETTGPFVVQHLKREIQKKFSFISDFDHARPALEALYFACHTLPVSLSMELYQAFASFIERIPFTMIGLDSINSVVSNIPESLIASDSSSSNLLIDFYFKNLSNSLKMHYEMTFISLARLIKNTKNSKKDQFIDVLNEEVSHGREKGTRNVFLLDILRDIKGELSQDQVSDLVNIVFEKILSPSSSGYSTERVGAFDNLIVSARVFNLMPSELKNQYLSKLSECLFDNQFSISNKIRVLRVLNYLSDKIDHSYFDSINDFISRNRERLFASTKTDDISPFRSSSFVNFRALLYSCAAISRAKKPLTFSLDLLRLSVSTESHVRELFVESVIRFINSNPDCPGNTSLLHRCYELTFDADPRVRGIAISLIVELFEKIDQEIKDSYLLRIINLSEDSSEISRAFLSYAVRKYNDQLPRNVFDSLKTKFEKDVSFHVRKNIKGLQAESS